MSSPLIGKQEATMGSSNFFGVDLDQFVTVPAARNMKCEVCGYKFLFTSSTECPHCGDAREAIAADGYDFLTANAVPIMDSIVGLKAANAHLTRQLAAQALAHAEQMKGLKTSRDTAIAGLQRAVVFGEKLQGDYQELERFSRARIVTNQSSCDEYDEMLAAKDARIAELDSELSAMRVTPATQSTDAQQTASDTKPAAQPKVFPASALNPPRTDQRRVGQ